MALDLDSLVDPLHGHLFVERLWRSLKYEDLYLKGYAEMGELPAEPEPSDGERLLGPLPQPPIFRVLNATKRCVSAVTEPPAGGSAPDGAVL